MQTDFDFSKDLYDFITRLNDGHTREQCLVLAVMGVGAN